MAARRAPALAGAGGGRTAARRRAVPAERWHAAARGGAGGSVRSAARRSAARSRARRAPTATTARARAGSPSSLCREFAMLGRITAGPDGNLWFTWRAQDRADHTGGVVSGIRPSAADAAPSGSRLDRTGTSGSPRRQAIGRITRPARSCESRSEPTGLATRSRPGLTETSGSSSSASKIGIVHADGYDHREPTAIDRRERPAITAGRTATSGSSSRTAVTTIGRMTRLRTVTEFTAMSRADLAASRRLGWQRLVR